MVAVLDPPTSVASETLDAIGRAFFATPGRQGGLIVVVAGALACVVLLVVLVRWVRRETRKERLEAKATQARHEAALADAAAQPQPAQDPGHDRDANGEKWARVDAHVRMTLEHVDRHQHVTFEDCETQSLSGGAVAFLTRHPPAEGTPLQFTLDLHEGWPLWLHGVVGHVEAAHDPDAPALVEVKLAAVAPAAQEHLARWVTHEELRTIASTRRGRMCPRCGRPLADGAGETHPTCVGRASPAPSRVSQLGVRRPAT
jgi:hypothetical protein